VLIGNSIGSLVSPSSGDKASGYGARVFVMMSLHLITVDGGRETSWVPATSRCHQSNHLLLLHPYLLFRVVHQTQGVRRWAKLAYASLDANHRWIVRHFSWSAGPGSAQAFTIFKAMIGAKFWPSVKTVLATLKIPMLYLEAIRPDGSPPATRRLLRKLEFAPSRIMQDTVPLDECPEQIRSSNFSTGY